MNKLLILIIFSFSVLAQTGQAIKSDKYTKDLFRVGDVKQSLLTATEFALVNGDCWEAMTGQSVASTELPSKGIATMPDLTGRFVRNTGGNAAAIGVAQAELLVSHKHLQNDVHRKQTASGQTYSSGNGEETRGTGIVKGTGSTSRTSPYTSLDNIGGTETKPINLTINHFIKVKEECNFSP